MTMQHGLIVEDGVARNYDPPGRTLTGIWDINPSQQFVGTYIVGGVRHGFLQLPLSSDGYAPAPINIDFPDATATIAYGINLGGVIVGQYVLSGRVHGFAAVPQTSN